MIDFSKYKRFFAFGCSMTKYWWPTWADIIANEIPESYNYGQSGGGNLFIASSIAEANQRFKFNETDLIMMMWSSIHREDRYFGNRWVTPGNIYTQDIYDEKFIKNHVDERGYLIRDLSIISLTRNMLNGIGVDYYMLSMCPIYRNPHNNIIDYEWRDSVELYKDIIDEIKPDIFTIECNGKWPEHPIKSKNSNQWADYHPDTQMHFNYLKKIFPNIRFSSNTEEFIEMHQTNIKNTNYLEDLKNTWNPPLPSRL